MSRNDDARSASSRASLLEQVLEGGGLLRLVRLRLSRWPSGLGNDCLKPMRLQRRLDPVSKGRFLTGIRDEDLGLRLLAGFSLGRIGGHAHSRLRRPSVSKRNQSFLLASSRSRARPFSASLSPLATAFSYQRAASLRSRSTPRPFS